LFILLLFAGNSRGQHSDVKFIADTLVVEAEGKYEADPDLALLTYSSFPQNKKLNQPPPPRAEKITVNATLKCAFQII
jgi:hypothetical protein